MYVCVCACMFVSMQCMQYVCVCVCVHAVCMCMCMCSVCMYVCEYRSLWLVVHKYVCVCVCVSCFYPQVYVGLIDDSESGHLEWRVDFSSCGLVVLNMKVLARSFGTSFSDVDGQERELELVDFIVRGEEVYLTPQLQEGESWTLNICYVAANFAKCILE